MTDKQDATPIETRYQQHARAAVEAAYSATRNRFPYGGTATEPAVIEAVGRIASALILADREEAR